MPGKNTGYSNFFLANEVEDQFNSHLDLQQFCTVDRSLVGTAGMTKKVNVYKATDGTEKLEIGAGNTKSITVSFSEQEYKILLAQNRFEYYDEEAMEDPMVVPVGMRHAGTDMFNTVNKDIFAEFGKTEQTLEATDYGFGTFADAVAMLNIEGTDNDPKVVAPRTFAFLNPKDMAAVRKALKDELKYVEAFARAGYVGSVAGVNLFTKKDATAGEIILATKQAVTLFVKKGVEVERYTPGNRGPENGNTRLNTIFTRKYYLAALTDKTKAVKITVSGE